MQFFIRLLCAIFLLFNELPALEKTSEKMIVSSSKIDKIAEEDLLKLKVYFIENTATRILQEKYNLELKMEILDEYKVVVIKPIESTVLRNELLILLSPVFKDVFYITYHREENQIKPTPIVNIKYIEKETREIEELKKSKNFLLDEVGLQWLALWVLSIVGLFLSIKSRRKVAALDKTQQSLKNKQEKIEIEIKKLGAQDE